MNTDEKIKKNKEFQSLNYSETDEDDIEELNKVLEIDPSNVKASSLKKDILNNVVNKEYLELVSPSNLGGGSQNLKNEWLIDEDGSIYLNEKIEIDYDKNDDGSDTYILDNDPEDEQLNRFVLLHQEEVSEKFEDLIDEVDKIIRITAPNIKKIIIDLQIEAKTQGVINSEEIKKKEKELAILREKYRKIINELVGLNRSEAESRISKIIRHKRK